MHIKIFAIYAKMSLPVGFTNNPFSLTLPSTVLPYLLTASPTNEPSNSHSKMTIICLQNYAPLHAS